jgi:hypothetical protein
MAVNAKGRRSYAAEARRAAAQSHPRAELRGCEGIHSLAVRARQGAAQQAS